MKIEMTERDKRLLIFLAIFVIVVCIGYWGILPVVKETKQIGFDIEEEKQLKEVNDLKLAQLPIVEKENEEYEQDIIKAKENFFDMMNSDQIDKYFTTMALDYDLFAYAMQIDIDKNQAELEAYKFSEKYNEDLINTEEEWDTASESESVADVAASGNDKTEEMIEDVDNAAAGITEEDEYFADKMVGIYTATVQMRLGGDEAMLQKLIDDLSMNEKKMRVVSYSWDRDSVFLFQDNQSYNYEYTKILNIQVEIYMCEE